jgi:transposase
MIQGSKLEPRTKRYELNDYEWRVIMRMLPNKPRGVPRMTGAFSMKLASIRLWIRTYESTP